MTAHTSPLTMSLPVSELHSLAGQALAPEASPAEVADWAGRLVRRLGGTVGARVAGGSVVVEWTPDPGRPPPADEVGSWFQAGRYEEAVVVSELLVGAMPTDAMLHYNLGMAYSDLGRLDRAVALLNRCLSLEPDHTNARVALGVALVRQSRVDEAVPVLEQAVEAEPENPWARRALGAALLRQGENDLGVDHLRKAVELNPHDDQAWVNLGQALESMGQLTEADDAYKQAIEQAGFGEVAELAQKGRSRIAEAVMRTNAGGTPRMDAVMYCLAAMQRFDTMSEAEMRVVVLEIATIGWQGLDVNDPDRRYSLRSMPGDYSGLQLVSYLYVGMRRIAPEYDVGFDLANEYALALGMHGPADPAAGSNL